MVSKPDIEKLAQNVKVKTTVFTSAKNGQNVEEAFRQIAKAIVTSNLKAK